MGGPEKFYVPQELNFEKLADSEGMVSMLIKLNFTQKNFNFILIHQTCNILTQGISQREHKYS